MRKLIQQIPDKGDQAIAAEAIRIVLAAIAMHALTSNETVVKAAGDHRSDDVTGVLARTAVRVADVLIEELNK